MTPSISFASPPLLQEGPGPEVGGAPSCASRDRGHPLLAALPELPDYVRLLRAEALARLPSPMPRCQDIQPGCFGVPCAGDLVLAVSHAWPHQAHPDADGEKLASVVECCQDMGFDLNRIFLFFDFLSIPQRPFRRGQKPRSPEETMRFAGALQRMHWVFFYADRVMHLEADPPKVAEEGATYRMPGSALRGARLGEIGGWVQIVAQEADERSMSKRSTRSGGSRDTTSSPGDSCKYTLWAVFDRIYKADNEEISCLAQVHLKMAQSGFEACQLELQRFPFGRPNSLPASARGWVFLERFITMVKCSMVSPEHLDAIIVSTREAALAQIREGAERLRKAASMDECARAAGEEATELGQALEGFFAELRAKAFSSTSIDKALNEVQVDIPSDMRGEASRTEKGDPADIEVAFALMRLFIEQLKGRWNEFENTQQGRTTFMKRMFQAATAMALHWDGFSANFHLRLQANAYSGGFWQSLVIVVGPVMCLFPLFLLNTRPDVKWRDATDYWCFVIPYIGFIATPSVVFAMDEFLGVYRTGAANLLLVLVWMLAGAAVVVAVTILPAALFDIFPVPFCSTAAVVGHTLIVDPLLYLFAPPSSRGLRRAYALCILMLYLGFAAIAYPMASGVFQGAPAKAQGAILLGIFGIRLIVECIGAWLTRRLGVDIMPLVVFFSMYEYQYTFCLVLLSLKHWLVLLELIAFSVVVKVYYVVELWRTPCESKRATYAPGRPMVFPNGRSERIVTLLIIRQTVEVFMPVQFIASVLAMRYLRPDIFGLADRPLAVGMAQSVQYLLGALAMEIAVSAGMVRYLQVSCFQPLAILRGVANVHWRLFLAVGSAVLLYNVSLQVPHFGSDMTLTFPWLLEPTAKWQRGTTWVT